MKVNTIEEYIQLFKDGHDLNELDLVENRYKELYNYVNLQKNEDFDYFLIYAICLLKGYGIDKNESKAFECFKKMAEQGNARAQNNLGICYYYGQGVEQSYERAVEWYSKSAEQGNARAQCNLGSCYYYGQGVEQSYERAVEWYAKSAEQGNARAQCNLGYCYEKGQGVEQSYERAVEWYAKSAEQGCAAAQNNLGCCYEKGQGVEQSYERAVEWYLKSAEQGYARAQNNLGSCYYYGQGVEQSYEQAVEWFAKSAEQGYASAQNNLGCCYEKGQGVEQSYEQAVEWYLKSAKQGYAAAQGNLGYCYEKGQGVEQSHERAVEWYAKSAEQGYDYAQCNLGFCYFYGQGVEQSYERAVEWYLKSAKQGYARAQCNLGICYRNGFGVNKDYNKALHYLEKSADQNYTRAFHQLSSLYTISTTSFRDLAKSMYYENLANGNSRALAYYNVGFNFYIDENISHNKFYRYGKALEYITKAYEEGLEYAKDFKEQLEELYSKEKLKVNDRKDYKELHIGKSKDVFISWNNKDLDIKNQLRDFIHLNHFTCWESGVDCHGDIRKACIEGVLDSSLFIVIITGNALESDYIPIEIKTMIERISSIPDLDYKKCIKPVFVDRYVTQKGEVKKIDVRKMIKKISKKEPNNPSFKLFKFLDDEIAFSSIEEFDLNGILKFIQGGLQTLRIKEYKESYLKTMDVFEGALQNTILSNQMASGAFSTTFKFEEAYINQPLFKDGILVSVKDILNSNQPVLIYGEGGMGKSLYLKNLTKESFSDNNFFFFLSSKEIISYDSDSFYEVLSKNFESYMLREINIDSIQTVLEHSTNYNTIYIVIDALDEISDSEKVKVLQMIYKFSNQYKNIHYIFSSRNSEDANLISSILHQETLAHTLKGMREEDISLLYDNIIKKAKCSLDKIKFLNVLNSIDGSIRKNPMIISNLIIIYLMSGNLPTKLYEIIKCMVTIVFENQEKDRDASFKYKDYFNEEELSRILEFIAYMRAVTNKSSSIELLDIYYSKYSSFKEELKGDRIVSRSVNEYLKRRGILVEGNIHHQIYNDYFASLYSFNHTYKRESDEYSIYLTYLKNSLDINHIIENITSYGEQWYNILMYFILEVDYICNTLGEKNKTNENILKELFVICLLNEKVKGILLEYLEKKQLYHSKLLKIVLEEK